MEILKGFTLWLWWFWLNFYLPLSIYPSRTNIYLLQCCLILLGFDITHHDTIDL